TATISRPFFEPTPQDAATDSRVNTNKLIAVAFKTPKIQSRDFTVPKSITPPNITVPDPAGIAAAKNPQIKPTALSETSGTSEGIQFIGSIADPLSEAPVHLIAAPRP